MEDFDDFPTVGLTPFDSWMTKLYVVMITSGFLNVTEFGTLDRDHFKNYFDMEYTPEDAFEEDFTCYGD